MGTDEPCSVLPDRILVFCECLHATADTKIENVLLGKKLGGVLVVPEHQEYEDCCEVRLKYSCLAKKKLRSCTNGKTSG